MWFKPAVMFTEDYNLICHAIGGNKDINEDLEGARKKAF